MNNIKITANNDAELKTTVTAEQIDITFKQTSTDCYLEAQFWPDFTVTGSEYVLFPACCYNGNHFDSVKRNYPPMFTEEEAAVNMPVTITDVPRLNKDGSGKIEITTGDVSVPCVGIYSKEEKRGILFYTIQEIDGINLGLSYEKGKIGVTYPHMRKEKAYRWPFMVDSKDKGIDFNKGKKIEIPYKLFSFPCESMEEFYQVFFENRKCMGMDAKRPEVLPFDKQFKIQRDKFNTKNWRESGRFYGVGTTDDILGTWQPGWIGGGLSSFVLMKLGGKLEWERAIDTLRHVFRTQAPSGLLYPAADSDGKPEVSSHGHDFSLIRESADVLYFLFKHFDIMKEQGEEIPQDFLLGTQKLADAFVRLWDKYGQFGQFVYVDTGDIFAGGSTSAGIAPAGLVSAYKFFGNEKYLTAAKESAELFYTRDVLEGYTTGGPAEILQGADSESAFGLLESYVELYDVTKEEKWLGYAKYMANLCSSWVVSYNYHFPKTSEFYRLDMKTVGSVFANVQNKHSAPGICTLSGKSLYKLYSWTMDERYLELLKDIALTISQYMSTDKRPIYSWDVPKDASLLKDDSIKAEREKLPEGFICERVNMSDWESERCIGGVFNCSCWPEVSNLLTLAEVVDLL